MNKSIKKDKFLHFYRKAKIKSCVIAVDKAIELLDTYLCSDDKATNLTNAMEYLKKAKKEMED
jgi:hypothetical protein